MNRPMARIPVLTIPEICGRWSTSKWTVLREITAGRLRAFRVGRQYRVYLDSVEAVEKRRAA